MRKNNVRNDNQSGTKRKLQWRTGVMLGVGTVMLCSAVIVYADGGTQKTQAGTFPRLAIETIAADELRSAVTALSITSNVVIADWPDDLLAHDAREKFPLQVRGMRHDQWSAWLPLEELEDMPDASLPRMHRKYSMPVFFDAVTQIQVRYRGAVTTATQQNFRNVEIVYLDSRTRDKEIRSIFQRLFAPITHAETPLKIVSRAEWGADESYRFVSGGSELWKREYLPVQKFIVHHTAGSDGGSDPAATVRGIYYFHAVVLGWGDIGYNYLIDPAGTIYEGRYGGDGVVGGHTFNSALNLNYNRGTTGIALLGNYDTSVPAQLAQDSLAVLIGQKAWQRRVVPTGTSAFLNGVIPAIVGHGDVDATACPGVNVHAALESIRQSAQAQYDALGPQPTPAFSATFGTQSLTSALLEKEESVDVIATYANTSNVTWQSYVADRKVSLQAVDSDADSKLKASSWISGREVGAPLDANVVPNGTAQFTFQITAPNDAASVKQYFALVGPDGVELANTRFLLDISVSGLDYAARVDDIGLPRTTFIKDTRTVTVKVTNTATKPWENGEVRLQLLDPNDQPSAFRGASWTDPSGSFVPDQPSIAPGQAGTFTFTVTAPKEPGSYQQTLRFIRTDGKPIAAEPVTVTTRADSHWKALFVSSSLPLAIYGTWRPTVTVKFQNTGASTWTRTTKLQIFDAGFMKSKFIYPTWKTSTADVQLNERSVPPGKIGTFTVRLKPPTKKGLYRQVFRLTVSGLKEPFQGNIAEILTRVD